jgi:hypothetical protein
MSRKRQRALHWDYLSVYRFDGKILAELTDPSETDRPVRLELSPEQAQYLGARLAFAAEQAHQEQADS